jgi:hypothetical protein
MNQLGSFLVLIVVAAVTLAAVGAVVAWYNEEGRRIRRGLRKVLKGETHALIVAHGSGRGAGFNFTSNTMAVAWDAGEWCLIYRIEELVGVELIVDGQVAGRTFRGEPRRAVDAVGGAERQVSLRLVFDDPQHADFILELWNAARVLKHPVLQANEAVEEGNRWLARLESIFRRQRTPRPAAAAPRAAEAAPAKAAPAEFRPLEAEPSAARQPEREPEDVPAPPPTTSAGAHPKDAHQELPFDAPPWDEDEQQALL